MTVDSIENIITTFNNDTEDAGLFETFKPKIAAYQKELKSSILPNYMLTPDLLPKESGISVIDLPEKILTKAEIDITELTAVNLAAKIANGELKSVDVFNAYAKRATAAHQLVNCAMQLFVDEGLQRAKELDEFYLKHKKTVGPLHGVPVSIKEHYDYKGKVTHGGYVSLIENVSTETNECVQILYDAGAVLYVRTTEPQSLMHLCSNNNITGLAKNPHNTNLTTGGSSSGEGAITAMKGSALGVGSDIGGSIRVPAAFCGVWGLRPTQKRIPLTPLTPSTGSVQELVVPVLGPLARSAEDLDLFMKVEIDSEPWKKDASLVPLPWRIVEEPKAAELKVAIIYDDGICKPTPPIIRGLKHAAEKLKAAGVKIVEWESFGVADCVRSCGTAYNADGCSAQKKLLAGSGEPVLKLTKTALSFGCGDSVLTGKQYEEHTYVKELYRKLYLDKMAALDVDYIISPTYVSVAAEPETIQYWGYANLWNFLDYPSVIFPTKLKCDPALDPADKTYAVRNALEEYEYGLYDDADKFKGAPISLQVTGRRWMEEELIKATKVIGSIVNK